ncbi:hypothetical protein [Bartonella rattaustraliani]|uniref:hypothetical protein n=1 Tax=Bartonella rattaustraliani TaxID=481139 RepID=UPI0002FB244A|nr:hypothetical protein [Bartonella rattaustraliani]
MLSKVFAISEISDPSQVRVVFLSGDHFVHAPLSGILDLLKSDLEVSLQGLEERLRALSTELEELKECSL